MSNQFLALKDFLKEAPIRKYSQKRCSYKISFEFIDCLKSHLGTNLKDPEPSSYILSLPHKAILLPSGNTLLINIKKDPIPVKSVKSCSWDPVHNLQYNYDVNLDVCEEISFKGLDKEFIFYPDPEVGPFGPIGNEFDLYMGKLKEYVVLIEERNK